MSPFWRHRPPPFPRHRQPPRAPATATRTPPLTRRPRLRRSPCAEDGLIGGLRVGSLVLPDALGGCHHLDQPYRLAGLRRGQREQARVTAGNAEDIARQTAGGGGVQLRRAAVKQALQGGELAR